MKILIVNSHDIAGGAARAAYRLHRSLFSAEIESQLLVQFKSSDDYSVITETGFFKKSFARLQPFLDALPLRKYKNRSKTHFSCNNLPFSSFANKINALKPDIVHLHWINNGMMNIKELSMIKAPILWTMHDNWAFTGGCHIMWECQNYQEKCGFCPRLDSRTEVDLSRKNWNRKRLAYSKLKSIHISTPSKWLGECVKKSSLLKSAKCVYLPNLIDTSVYRPIDKSVAREILNLPLDKKIVLFGSMNVTSDVNKGFKLLSEAINKLNLKNIELVIFGGSKPLNAPGFKYPIHYTGQLHDDVALQLIYSASDVMVIPSLQENLSYAIMESLSCGTPVVAFNIGGNAEMIDHLKNGFLATPFDTDNLASGIDWVLTNEHYSSLAYHARQKILNQFDSSIVKPEYIKTYEEILNGKLSIT